MSDIVTQYFYGKVKGINSSDGMNNLLTTLPEGIDVNIKTETKNSDIKIGYIYKMKVAKHLNSERNVYYLVEYTSLSEIEDIAEVDKAYRLFDCRCPYSLEELMVKINGYINQIDNKVIFDVTKKMVESTRRQFFTFPAASRFHHNYVGGLAYHTIGMLELAQGLINCYQYLDKDYLYAGIILHDIGKIVEFTGVENTEYTVEGQLLGHLVIGGIQISKVADELGYSGKEEVLLLEHMVISHHGNPLFGAAKKPQTPEAMMLWYIDTLDSKFRVLGEEINKVEPGKFSEPIGVLDKTKFYRKK